MGEGASAVTAAAGAPGADIPPLAGFSVGVTAARRADELAALIQRRGATVLHGPAIRIIPLPDDAALLSATKRVVQEPVDVVVATTGVGFRGWVEAAEGWGLGACLLSRLRGARLVARGPKAKGAVRAAGLVEAWSPGSESNAEVLDHLLRSRVRGQRVALQLHGAPLPDFVRSLRRAGAEVVEIPVYQWARPEDPAPLDRLLDAIVSRRLNAVTFTSAPAAINLLRRCAQTGRYEAVVDALRSDVLVACVGAISAGPLAKVGIEAGRPERPRLGSLVRQLVTELPARAQKLRIGGQDVEVRGQAVVVGGKFRPVPAAPMAILRALAANPGRVVCRQQLLLSLRGNTGRECGGDEHAVETAIGRLRLALGEPDLVQTVIKRGYRLPIEPTAAPR